MTCFFDFLVQMAKDFGRLRRARAGFLGVEQWPDCTRFVGWKGKQLRIAHPTTLDVQWCGWGGIGRWMGRGKGAWNGRFAICFLAVSRRVQGA